MIGVFVMEIACEAVLIFLLLLVLGGSPSLLYYSCLPDCILEDKRISERLA